jgi:hypothetical protein
MVVVERDIQLVETQTWKRSSIDRCILTISVGQ